MATVTLQGNPFKTCGELPTTGSKAPSFTLVQADLADITLADCAGQRVILNVFPSIDTPTCATSVRQFNQRAADIEHTRVICVSADLPFATGRFCGAEGIDGVTVGSTFRSSFGEDYGVAMADGPLTALLSRAVIVLDTDGTVLHTEQVAEIADEPNYESALAVL